jgi:hypothetical protein
MKCIISGLRLLSLNYCIIADCRDCSLFLCEISVTMPSITQYVFREAEFPPLGIASMSIRSGVLKVFVRGHTLLIQLQIDERCGPHLRLDNKHQTRTHPDDSRKKSIIYIVVLLPVQYKLIQVCTQYSTHCRIILSFVNCARSKQCSTASVVDSREVILSHTV